MINDWIIESNSLDNNDLLRNESLFHVANGYIGVRGNFEEGYPEDYKTIRGTLINAFYDIVPIDYGEKAYAFPETMQKLVNVIDTETIYISINDETFSLFQGEVKAFRRYIDMEKGYYRREISWVSPLGKELNIIITRIASFTDLELFAVNYEIEKVNFEDKVVIRSIVNGEVSNFSDDNDPRVAGGYSKLLDVFLTKVEANIMQIACVTKTSKQSVVATTTHVTNAIDTTFYESTEASIEASFTFKEGSDKINFTKYNVYTDSRRYSNPIIRGRSLIKKLSKTPFEVLLKKQEEYLIKFWSAADVNIQGEVDLQLGVRFNAYQLLQSAGRDSISNIAAKGLSGEGYEGHYFWDTEIYMMPFFNLCNPKLAKNLLRYRYSILDSARKRAKELGHKKGAAYPWRTISGEECSSFFPAGTAQYHINGDIAYSFIQYYLVTEDLDFIKEFGAEVIMETARTWIEIGHFQEEKFKIDMVTGPDEYTALVNNNYYTNVIAKYNLKWAVKLYYLLKMMAPENLKELTNKIYITKEEVDLWQRASKNMYLPYDSKYKINAQDDSFLSKAVWDFENTPEENYPLLLHYHPLTIYRYQVLKQADTVLAHFLIEEESDEETIKNSYDYYEKLTTHDSSLSCAIYSIMAAKIGYSDKAYDYFIKTARLDLDDIQANTKDGIHTANMGGTWMSIVFGFAGLRIKEDMLCFNPNLPKKWRELSFTLQYKDSMLKVTLKQGCMLINVKGDKLIKIKIGNNMYEAMESKDLCVNK
jgi:alpha,alpha-trehalose phosphorylase